jgi:hypothetical protein
MTEDRGTLVASYVAPEEAGSGQLASGTEHAPAPATVQTPGRADPDHLTELAMADDGEESRRQRLGALDAICL